MNLFLSFYLLMITICHIVSLEAKTNPNKTDLEWPAKNIIARESDLNEESQESGHNQSSIELSPAVFDWPKGQVPFFIDSNSYDAIVVGRIRLAMKVIELVSCVDFKPMAVKAPEFSNYMWLSIENPTKIRRCIHRILHGANGKVTLIIGFECMKTHQILHSLMHALGFHDEITHPQRDTYVRIIWPNIQPQYRSLFWMRSHEKIKEMVEYDTMSIMHFHDRAYSTNGAPTIVPLVPGLKINPSEKLSQLDVMKLQLKFERNCHKFQVKKLYETCQAALERPKKDQDHEDDNNINSEDSDGEQVVDLSSPNEDKIEEHTKQKKEMTYQNINKII